MIPIFRSNFSLTSILTLDAAEDSSGKNPNTPDSVFQLCKDNNIKECYLVDNTLSSLVDAYENAKKSNLKLRYGYRVEVCSDILDKSIESETTESKFIIFATKNTFDDLIRLHNISTTIGLYKSKPRLDFKTLKENWSDNLCLAVPFYDSYIHRNLLYGSHCVPDLDFTEPVYFKEDNDLPFDHIISNKISSILDSSKILNSKTIYYKSRDTFKAYMAYRCILNRTTFQKPELQHFGSKEFCLESYLENSN
jgi:DNA polymerase III alpha subunit